MRISDWSSDVCSSDLPLRPGDGYVVSVRDERLISHNRLVLVDAALGSAVDLGLQPDWERMVWSPRDAAYFIPVESRGSLFIDDATSIEIGSASCRERVCQSVSISVVAVSLKKK